jgi:hypothetical protein
MSMSDLMIEVDSDIIDLMNSGMSPEEIKETIELTHGSMWTSRVDELILEVEGTL